MTVSLFKEEILEEQLLEVVTVLSSDGCCCCFLSGDEEAYYFVGDSRLRGKAVFNGEVAVPKLLPLILSSEGDFI
jgi:hypothetical protein